MASVSEDRKECRFYCTTLAVLVLALWVSTQMVEAWRVGCYLLTFWAWDVVVDDMRRKRRDWQRKLLFIDSYVIMIIVLGLEVLHDVQVWRTHDLGIAWNETTIRHSAEELSHVFNVSVPVLMKDIDLASTYIDRRLLIWIPLFAPVYVCIIGLCSSFFAMRHLFIMWKSCPDALGSETDRDAWNENLERRKAVIGINFLPLVYALMALKGALRSWQCMTLSFPSNESLTLVSTWHGRKGMVRLLQIYSETSLSIADAYEAWAVSLFGKLIMNVVGATSDTVVSGPYASQRLAQRLRKSLFGIADKGLVCFQIIAMATSVYTLVVSLIEFDTVFLRRDLRFIVGGINVLDPMNWPDISIFCSGMGNVATTMAIIDLIILEGDFKCELESMKWVFHKFLSIKILVSLVFFQQLVLFILKRFMGWSEFQGVLASSGILCFECMLLCFYHVLAWGHHEKYLNLTAHRQNLDNYEAHKNRFDEALRSLAKRSQEAERLSMELRALQETFSTLELQAAQPGADDAPPPANATHRDSSNAHGALSQPLLAC